MSKTISALLPATQRRLHELGERIRLARLRRKLTAASVAERAGMAPMTLRGVERGEWGVTVGAYAAVLQVLGLEGDLDLVGADDAIGRQLQDSRLGGIRASEPVAPYGRRPQASPEPRLAPAQPRPVEKATARKPAAAHAIDAAELAQLIADAPAPRRKR